MQVYLKGDAPREVATLLDDAGLGIVSPVDAEAADIVTAFAREPSSSARGRAPIRLRVESRGGDATHGESAREFAAENAVHAASIIVSSCIGARAPMLTGDEATFSEIASALRAPFDMPILLEGETGTGKETLARMIHAASGAVGGFFAVDCSTPAGEGPAESMEPRHKALGAASRGPWPGGTIFLDNVDEASPAMQQLILGAIRLRSQADEAALRYVASSRRPLGEMARQGLFNRELYGALAGLTVSLPALRHRGGDISLLARGFLASGLGFTPAALRALSEYPFPGNVRELKNLVKRLAIVPLEASGATVDASDVRAQIIVASRQKAERPRASWRGAIEAANQEIALRTVAALGGDIKAAAHRLGLSAASLSRSIRSARAVSMPVRRDR